MSRRRRLPGSGGSQASATTDGSLLRHVARPPRLHLRVSADIVSGAGDRERIVMIALCPFCDRLHQHVAWGTSFTSGIRRAPCGESYEIEIAP